MLADPPILIANFGVAKVQIHKANKINNKIRIAAKNFFFIHNLQESYL